MRLPEQSPDPAELVDLMPELLKALSDSHFNQVYSKCQHSYKHWHKVKSIARQEGTNAELLWFRLIMSREGLFKELPLSGTQGEQLRYTIPDQLQQELMLIDRTLSGSLQADNETPLTQQQHERYIVSGLHEEAIASSMLEGAATTRQDAKKMLRANRKPRNRGETMVLNNYRAIQYIRENTNQPLTPDMLLELQKILTQNTLDDPDQAGRFRNASDNVVVETQEGQVLHTPPPAVELSERIGRLCDFANKTLSDDPFIHPVVRACILHFQLGSDHPFCDGNGRTARALFYWYMLRNGYWLFEFISISHFIYKSSGQYRDAFLYCEADQYDVTYFLMYHAKILRLAREQLVKYISRKQREMTQTRELFASDASLNHRQREQLLRVLRNPAQYFTLAEYQTIHNVSYGTGNSDLHSLASSKYLNRSKSGNRYDYSIGQKLLDYQQSL